MYTIRMKNSDMMVEISNDQRDKLEAMMKAGTAAGAWFGDKYVAFSMIASIIRGNDKEPVDWEHLQLEGPVTIKLTTPERRAQILAGIEKAVGKNEFYHKVKRQIEVHGEVTPSAVS